MLCATLLSPARAQHLFRMVKLGKAVGKAFKKTGKTVGKAAKATAKTADKVASKVERSGLLDRILEAMEYYDAHNDLPPTFETSSYGLSTMPDPVTKEKIRAALQRAHDAEQVRLNRRKKK